MKLWQETKYKLLHLGAAILLAAIICTGIMLMTMGIVTMLIGALMVAVGVVFYVRLLRHMARSYNITNRF